ncbi:MAG TPA: HigA family addiction module antitoxin [Terracidiphilus sp.]|nr:HigA family addiction module antitoxin [Terracidiphilus sp.]
MDSGNKFALDLDATPHPGELVLEYLAANGWTQQDLARRTELTPKTISELCNGKTSVSPQTALLFEKVLQRPARFWLNLQRQFDEAHERERRLLKASDWLDWARSFPLKEMRDKQFSLPEGHSEAETLLSFFGVSSPRSWESVWKAAPVAYRQTRSFSVHEQSVAAWVREAELLAFQFDLAEFSERLLTEMLPELRQLTRRSGEEIIEPVQKLCAAAGVAVVWVPELRNTGISGCARWLNDKWALVGLTLRYKWDDQMWFTLFHEIGHLVLHRSQKRFVIDNAAEDLTDPVIDPEMRKFEVEANQFAADSLIAPEMLGKFIKENSFTNESIHSFAELIGVGPGIVVGRLQHDGILKPHQGNKLKQKLNWKFVDEE